MTNQKTTCKESATERHRWGARSWPAAPLWRSPPLLCRSSGRRSSSRNTRVVQVWRRVSRRPGSSAMEFGPGSCVLLDCVRPTLSLARARSQSTDREQTLQRRKHRACSKRGMPHTKRVNGYCGVNCSPVHGVLLLPHGQSTQLVSRSLSIRMRADPQVLYSRIRS